MALRHNQRDEYYQRDPRESHREPQREPPRDAGRSSAIQNEYFIDGDGIAREVIQADICRYLGNDALVKPGVYQVRIPCLYCSFPIAS